MVWKMLPIILDVKDKKILIFGGGEVSERRARKFLDAKAKVTIISKDFTPQLKKMNVNIIEREVKKSEIPKLIKNYDIILACTSDEELNNSIEEEARKRGKLVTRADKISDFIIPASFEVEGVLIAVSTLGKSPALAKLIKRRIAKLITKEDVKMLKLQEYARELLKNKIPKQRKRKEILKSLFSDYDIANKDIEEAKKIIRRKIECFRE